MTKLKFIVLLIAIGLLTGIGVSAAEIGETEENKQQENKTIKHILYITAEGLTEARLQSAYTPNINGLAASGVKASAVGVLPANSASFLTSLLTGTGPLVHGLTEPGRQLKAGSLPEVISGYGRTAVIVSYPGSLPKEFFKSKNSRQVRHYEIASAENRDVMSRAVKEFTANKPFFLGIHLPGIKADEAKKIGTLVNSVDEQIGKMLTTLRAEGVYDECLIVIAGYSQNSAQKEQSEKNSGLSAPLIMQGPGLRNGSALPPVKITDVAPTTALLTGLQMPPETSGLILWNAIQPGAGYREENLLFKRIKDLSEENIGSEEAIYRLMGEKQVVKTEKEKIDREKTKIHQTIENKDKEISWLKIKIKFLKTLEFVTILALGTGYVAEYFYLRKKFLMF